MEDTMEMAGVAAPASAAWWSTQVELLRAHAAHASPGERARALVDMARTLELMLVDLEAAAANYQAALEAQPGHPGALAGLARLAEQQGDTAAELAALEALAAAAEPGSAAQIGALVRIGTLQVGHDRPAAFAAFAQAATACPDDPELLLRARLALPADDLEGREWLLAQLLSSPRSGPDQARLLLGRGRAAERAGSDQAALADYQAAHQADPDLRPAIDGIIRLHARHGRWYELVEALGQLARAVGDDRTRGRLVYLSALISATHLDEGERSRGLVGQAATLVADDVAAMLELVAQYEQFEMWGPANLLLESVAEGTSPVEAAAAHYRIGLNSEVGLGEPERALKAYKRAVEARADHVPALLALRRCAWRADDMETYVMALDRLARVAGPELGEAFQVHLADIAELRQEDDLAALRRLDAAVDQALASDRRFDQMPLPLLEAHRLYLATENHGGLAERLERLLEAHAERPLPAAIEGGLHGWLGELYETWLERHDDAVEHYRIAVELDPDDGASLAGLCRLMERRDEPRALAETFEWAADLVGPVRGVPLLVRAARVYGQMQDLVAIERVWRRALSLDPENLPAMRGLGRLLFEARRWPELADLYRAELDALPADDPYRAELLERLGALTRLDLEDPEASIGIYETLRASAPDSASANAALESLYAQSGRWSDLAALLRDRAERIESPSLRATVRLHLARLYHGVVNDPDAAREAYEDVLADAPDAWPAVWGLERLIHADGDRQALAAHYTGLFDRTSGPTQAVVGFKLAGLLPPEVAQPYLERVLDARIQSASASAAAWLLERAAENQDMGQVAVRLAQMGQHSGSGREMATILTEAAEVATVNGAEAGIRHALWDRIATLTPDEPRPLAGLLSVYGPEQATEAAGRWTAWAEIGDDPRGRSVALWTAALLLAPVDPSRAGELVRAASEVDVDDPVPAWLTLDLFGAHLDPNARVAVLEEAAANQKSGPVAARWLYEAGMLRAESLDDLEGALKDFVESVGRDPAPEAPFDAAVAVLASRSAYAEIAELIELRLARLDDPAVTRSCLEQLAALQLDELGQRERAVQSYERLVQLAPDDPGPKVVLADLLYGDEQYPQAVAHYAQAVGLVQDERELSRLYRRLGKTRAFHLDDAAGAIEDLRQAVGLSDPDGEALETLANVYLMADEAELAQLAYQRLERVVGEDPARLSVARAGLVRSLLAAGREGEAAERLRAYREADPVDPALAALARDIPEAAAAPPPLPATAPTPEPEPVLDDSWDDDPLAPIESIEPSHPVASVAPEPEDAAPDDDRDVAMPPPAPVFAAPPVEDVFDDAGLRTLDLDPEEDVEFAPVDSVEARLDEEFGPPIEPLRSSAPPPKMPPLPVVTPRKSGSEAGPKPRTTLSGRIPLRRNPTPARTMDTVELEVLFSESGVARRARARVAAEPLEPTAWMALRKEVETSPAKTQWIDSILAWVEGRPDEKNIERRRDMLPNALLEPLVPDGVPPSALVLFKAVGRKLDHLFPSDFNGTLVAADGPLYEPVQHAAGLLGLSQVNIYAGAGRAHTLSVEEERWCLNLGYALAHVGGSAGVGFLAARTLTHARLGTLAAPALQEREFRPFLAALISALGQEYPVPTRDRAATDRFRASITPAVSTGMEGVEAAAAMLARDHNTFPATSIRVGLHTLASRVAMALASNFTGAIEMMRALEYDERPRGDLAPDELQRVIADNEAVRDLLVFAGSRACLAIRAWLADEAESVG